MDSNYSLADIALATGNRNDSGMGFGGDGAWWIIILFLFGIFGWGNGGWGNANGGQNGGVGSEVQRGFDHSSTITKLDGITHGICDSTYALSNAISNGVNTLQMGMMQGFNGVERGFCNLSSQLSDCCCQTQRAIDGVNYNMAKNTCDLQNTMNNNTRDLLDNQNSNTRAILDFLTQDKIATLQAENQSLKFQASQTAQNAYIAANQEAQTAELIRRLGRDCPVPAYVVPNPNCCYGNPMGIGYNQGCNAGCCA